MFEKSEIYINETLMGYMNRYFQEEKIENFKYEGIDIGDIVHTPVIIRNIDGNKNPFSEIPSNEVNSSFGIIRDGQTKTTQLYGNYLWGYLVASRSSKSYKDFKNNFSWLSELIIMDLQDKLKTSGVVGGSLFATINDSENYAGVVISVDAKVGSVPPSIIDASIADPSDYKQWNLDKAWTKQ